MQARGSFATRSKPLAFDGLQLRQIREGKLLEPNVEDRDFDVVVDCDQPVTKSG